MDKLANLANKMRTAVRRLVEKFLEWRVRKLRYPSLWDRLVMESSWRGWWARAVGFYGGVIFLYFYTDIYVWVSRMFFNQIVHFGADARGRLMVVASPLILIGAVASIVSALQRLNKDNEKDGK